MQCYRARWIVPVAAPPIEDGALLVADGAIVAVGPFREHRMPDVVDLGDAILLPGLINAHTHLELPAISGQLPRDSLWSWLDALIGRLRASGGRDERAATVAAGAVESIRGGVTCVADISRTGANVRPLSVSPIRKVCFIELISGAGQCPSDAGELFGLVAAPAALSEPGRLLIGVSPHSLYNVTESDLAAIGRRLVDSPRPMTVHFLEAQDEARWLRDRSGPAADFRHRHPLREVRDYPSGDAVDILARCGLLGVRPILAHGNDVQPADFPTLAAAGASVVWCPRTCAYFGHGPHPWGSMLRAGLNVCLGTDSLASNPDLSILEEMRYVRRHVASAPASTILKMATIFAARALGLDAWIGQLAAGRRADFVCVPWDGDGASDPVGNLLEGPGAAGGVWIDGIRVDVPVA